MTGTVELLPVGAFGVDDSFQPPALDDMLAIGVQFESRYICIDSPATHDKLWTLDRLHRNADAGILAQVNYEQSQGTTLTGEAGGRKHGKVAGDWRAYLGMPDDLPIVVTTDVGVTSSQFNAIADFCAAFKDEAGPIGHYHGTTLCAYLEDRGLNELTWMAMATAWSPGGETPRVHVRQKGYVLGSCDANYVRKPTPFWNVNGVPPSPFPPQEVTMPGFSGFAQLASGEIVKFLVCNDGKIRWADTAYEGAAVYAAYPGGVGIPPADITGMEAYDPAADVPAWYKPGSGGGGVTEQQVRDLLDSTYLQTGT